MIDRIVTYADPITTAIIIFIVVVRRQSYWDRERLKIRESLARLVFNVMRPADGAASGDWRLSFV